MVALVAAWGLPAMAQTDNAFFRVGLGEHVLNRSVGVIDSHGLKGTLGFLALVPLYFVTFIVSFFPWTVGKPPVDLETWIQKQKRRGKLWRLLMILLWGVLFVLYIPIKIWRWWPARRRDDLGWYLLVQAALVFGVFSLVRTKLPHYTMPAFPCLALWFARQIGTEANAFAWFGKRVAAMTVFVLLLTFVGFAIARNNFLTTKLWLATQAHVRPETKIGCFGYTEPSLVWEFRKVSTNRLVLGDVKAAKNFLTNAPPFILVLPTKDLASLPGTNGLHLQEHGLDMVKFKNWDLTALVRP
jgi:hypothetical protein